MLRSLRCADSHMLRVACKAAGSCWHEDVRLTFLKPVQRCAMLPEQDLLLETALASSAAAATALQARGIACCRCGGLARSWRS